MARPNAAPYPAREAPPAWHAAAVSEGLTLLRAENSTGFKGVVKIRKGLAAKMVMESGESRSSSLSPAWTKAKLLCLDFIITLYSTTYRPILANGLSREYRMLEGAARAHPKRPHTTQHTHTEGGEGAVGGFATRLLVVKERATSEQRTHTSQAGAFCQKTRCKSQISGLGSNHAHISSSHMRKGLRALSACHPAERGAFTAEPSGCRHVHGR